MQVISVNVTMYFVKSIDFPYRKNVCEPATNVSITFTKVSIKYMERIVNCNEIYKCVTCSWINGLTFFENNAFAMMAIIACTVL